MSAHNIGPDTLLGFKKDDKLFYITYDYDVKELYTGETVAYKILNTSDVLKLNEYTPIYAKNIAPGRDINIRSNNQKLKKNIGISISQITIDKDWFVTEFLCYTKAVKLMHKWFTEHKLSDIYQKQHNMSPIKGFTEWVTGPMITFFSGSDKHIWYQRAMAIDYEMEKKDCKFTDCYCEEIVPIDDKRKIIPWQLYEVFNLLNQKQMSIIWKHSKPETEEEANLALNLVLKTIKV